MKRMFQLLTVTICMLVALALAPPIPISAEAAERGHQRTKTWSEGRPYGDYCPQQQGRYGSTRGVESEEAARRILESYYRGQNVSIRSLERRRAFYRAEITDASGTIVDIVIIDSRTGRIRSTF